MSSPEAAARYPYPPEDPAALRTAGLRFADIGDVLRDTAADVDDDTLLLSGSWDSDVAATAVDDVGVLAALLPQDGARLHDAAEALRRYVLDVEGTRDRIDALRQRYDAAVAARDEANGDLPEGLERNRFEREEYRRSNQTVLDQAAARIDADYDDELRLLATATTSASTALTAVLDHLAPRELRQAGSYGTSAYDSAALVLSLAAATGAANDPARREAQAAAFEEMFGRAPASPTDWSMAAMLDTQSYQDKNGDAEAIVRVGRVTPQPGRGLVRMSLYIPSAEVFNVPNYDLGDDRGPDAHFDPEQSRVSIYIDYETGTVVVRQNPSVATNGEVRVDAPTVAGVAETTSGAIRIEYDAENPFAPPDPTNSHTVKGQFVVTPPETSSDDWRIDGEIGDYPAFEAYHDDPLGRTTVLLQDAADNDGSFGPLIELPQHHDLGDGTNSSAFGQFSERGRHVSGPNWEWHPRPNTPLGTVDDPPQVGTADPYGDFYEDDVEYV